MPIRPCLWFGARGGLLSQINVTLLPEITSSFGANIMKNIIAILLKNEEYIIKYIYFLIICCSFFAANFTIAQSITWQRTYDGIDRFIDGGYGVCKADGDNIYVAGYTTLLPNRQCIYVLKLNPYGDTIWTRTISLGTNGGESAFAIVSSNDGGCVVTGDGGDAFTIKLDLYGNIIWNKNYGGGFIQTYSIIKTSDGGYIACGRDAECSIDCAYILKIDSLGNLQWQMTYNTPFVKQFYGITETLTNDGYIVVGVNINSPTDTPKGLVMKIDISGNVIWEKTYRIDGAATMISIKKIANGYLIGGNHIRTGAIGGRNFITKINNIGDTVFVKSIQSTAFRKYFGGMEVINPNRYVISSYYDTANGGSINGNTVVLDSLGNVIYEKNYLSLDILVMKSVLPLPNGDIVFAGGVDFDPVYPMEDVYVLRTDSMLNAPPVIGIYNEINNVPAEFKLYQNFPNPFNPVTNIKYEMPKDAFVTLKVYDLLGKEVFSINEFKKAGSYEVQFDGSNLASGMYFYSLEVIGYKDTKKMVLLK